MDSMNDIVISINVQIFKFVSYMVSVVHRFNKLLAFYKIERF